LFRLQLFSSIFFVKKLITSGHVLLNKRVITFPSYFMKNNDILTFTPALQRLIFFKMKKKLRQRRLLFALPYYINFCFSTFSIKLTHDLILSNTLYYPINLNFAFVRRFFRLYSFTPRR
jgi:ribosomal protein S4